MYKSDYQFWLAYHSGKINRRLTKKEYSEIRASDFAMHLLIPTDKLLEKCGGLDILKGIDINYNYRIIKNLARVFYVPEEVMAIKINYIKNKKNTDNKITSKEKILKKEGNIIFVNFN